MAIRPEGYKNPLAAAAAATKGIDQGVDYAGAGALSAIGVARITYLATLRDGLAGSVYRVPAARRPRRGLLRLLRRGTESNRRVAVGQIVSAGEAIATIIPDYPTGIELGWAAGDGTKPYAALSGQWSLAEDEQDQATGAGKNFSALIASLGGPPGKVEG